MSFELKQQQEAAAKYASNHALSHGVYQRLASERRGEQAKSIYRPRKALNFSSGDQIEKRGLT